MIIKRSPFILLCLYFLTACSVTDNEQLNFEDKFTLERSEVKKITLDSLTSAIEGIANLSYLGTDKQGYIIFLNGLDKVGKAYVYDYKSGKLVKLVSFDKEGPNAFAPYPIALSVASLDSMFVYSNSTYITFFNDKQEVLKQFPIANFKGEDDFKTSDSIILAPHMNGKMIAIGDFLYTHTYYNYKGKYHLPHSVAVRINLNTGKREDLPFSYPKLYQTNYYGKPIPSVFASLFYCDYNPKTQKFIYSFPADKHVYVVNLNHDQVESYNAQSKYCDTIPPVTDKEMEIYSNSGFDDRSHVYSRCFYGKIVYDSYNDVYYREVKQAVAEAKIPDTNWFSQPKTIVILDKNFQKIGEYNLPTDGEYALHNMFCTPDGLSLPRTKVESEDVLTIDIFKLKALNQ